jgi:hypothetical protein
MRFSKSFTFLSAGARLSIARRALVFVLPLALLGELRAQVNLLTNPGAESGSTAGWQDSLGNGFGVFTPGFGGVNPISGSFGFHGGVNGPSGPRDNEIYQDIDLSSHAAAIDAGLIAAVFSGWGRSAEAAGSTDVASITVEYRNAAAAVVQVFQTGAISPTNTWVHAQDTRTLPIGVRTVRVRLHGHRQVGASTDAFFDDLALGLSCQPVAYGTPKVNSLGCTPQIGASGLASVSSAAPFLVTATNVLSHKQGLLFYGTAPTSQPFQGGFKLVASPTVRTALQNSGGASGANDCTGTYSLDMNARIQSAIDPNLVLGAQVYCQYWSRDPASASTTGLTNALAFAICQ